MGLERIKKEGKGTGVGDVDIEHKLDHLYSLFRDLRQDGLFNWY